MLSVAVSSHNEMGNLQNILKSAAYFIGLGMNLFDKYAISHNLSFFSTLYLIETPFDAFANRADPDQAALIRAA